MGPAGGGPQGRNRGDPTRGECPSSGAASPLSEGGPAGADPPRADGRCRRHSRAYQTEQRAPRALGRAPPTERSGGGRLHAGGPCVDASVAVTIQRPGRETISEILDRVLDRGIVIGWWGRVLLVGIDLVTIVGHVVVQSVDTRLRHADEVNDVALIPAPSIEGRTSRSRDRGRSTPVLIVREA